MFYETPLTVPAGTEKSSPVEQVLHVAHGVITRVEVEFNPGCNQMVHVVILYSNHQVWPTNPDGDFASDSHTIGFDDYFQVFDTPYDFVIRAWTDGTTYDHDIRVRLGELPEVIAEHIYGKLTQSSLAALQEAFGLLPGGSGYVGSP